MSAPLSAAAAAAEEEEEEDDDDDASSSDSCMRTESACLAEVRTLGISDGRPGELKMPERRYMRP